MMPNSSVRTVVTVETRIELNSACVKLFAGLNTAK